MWTRGTTSCASASGEFTKSGPGKFELDKIGHALLEFVSFQDTSGQGKRVRNPRGPAAVNGDETRRRHCSPFGEWEGAGSRMNHKPEDLPEGAPLFPRGLGNRRG